MLVKIVRVIVVRDMAEKIPVTCAEHEVEVLKDMHGAENVSYVDDEVVDAMKPVEIDVGMEFGRLEAAYGMGPSGMSHVEHVFGPSERGLSEWILENGSIENAPIEKKNKPGRPRKDMGLGGASVAHS